MSSPLLLKNLISLLLKWPFPWTTLSKSVFKYCFYLHHLPLIICGPYEFFSLLFPFTHSLRKNSSTSTALKAIRNYLRGLLFFTQLHLLSLAHILQYFIINSIVTTRRQNSYLCLDSTLSLNLTLWVETNITISVSRMPEYWFAFSSYLLSS